MKLLHLEDIPHDAVLAARVIRAEWPDCRIDVIDNGPEFVRRLDAEAYDLILSDFSLPGFDGKEALAAVRARSPDLPFIFLTGTIGEERAIEVIRLGASDCVIKDRLSRVVVAIKQALRERDQNLQHRAVEEANRRLVAILENTTDFVGLAAPGGKLFYLNRAGQRMAGVAENRDPGTLALQDLLAPEAAEQFAAEALPAAARDGLWSGESLLRGANGRSIPVSAVILSHRGADGRVQYYSALLRDLTPHREADRRSREQLDLLNKAQEGIIVSDLDGRVTFWNRGAEAILGWTAAEMVGRFPGEVARDELLAELTAARDFSTSAEWRGDLAVRHRNGQPVIVELAVSPIGDAGQPPRARLVICIDATAKRQMEEQFLRAQRLETIGMLASGMAHDLNNVLAPIMLASSMLRERATDPGDLGMLASLEKSAERGAALIRQILGFAQGISGPHQWLELKHVLREVAAVVAQTFPKKISLVTDFAPNLRPIKGNATQVQQVLMNLCVNARDAMPNGGTLRLGAENRVLDEAATRGMEGVRPGPFTVLTVADTGTGIPPEIMEKVWQPFFTTKEIGKGTGLGLSTVRGILQNHAGFITLDSVSGKGTTFRAYFPATEIGAALDPAVSAAPAPRGRGELILVVDDEDAIRSMTAAVLFRHGYRVLAAHDGVEAMVLFASRGSEIAAVITDVNMPNLDGNSLAQLVRRLNPSVAVLKISGLASGSASSQPPDNPVITKPFTPELLLARLREILDRSPR